ncbi:GTPase domain-containing protein [Actinoplanes sp. NPDC051861]|uniref:GTPase domain-containing protein n=1 Tax=Actinoplanes sp. NPDC051861 TaxID=3155170 RepID=UPI00341EB8B1
MRLLRSMINGRTITVAGPARSGKTTFADYLHYGAFEHAHETPTTYSASASGRFDVAIGERRNLEMIVRNLVDLPGLLPDQSEPVFDINPHAIVIVLDASAPLHRAGDPMATATWLEHFIGRLDQRWANAARDHNRLRSLTVAINKADLVKDDRVSDVGQECRAILDRHLRAARGPRLVEATFRRCSMVENPSHTKWVDSILFETARNLSR